MKGCCRCDRDSKTMNKREKLYKLVVIGDLLVGKTSFIGRLVHGMFRVRYNATIGVDFRLKVATFKNVLYRLQIWDIAGQERYGNNTKLYYKDSALAIIIYDVTRYSTFEAVPKWLSDFQKKCANIPFCVLANKVDQPKAEGKEFPSFKEALFSLEISSKTGYNIEEVLHQILEYFHHNDVTFIELPPEVKEDSYKKCDHYSKSTTVLIEGHIKSMCLPYLPFEFKNISAQDVAVNCIKAGYVYTKWLWISRKRFLVLKGNYLYWFRDERSKRADGLLNLLYCRSLSTDEERNSFTMTYLKHFESWLSSKNYKRCTLKFNCFDDKENCVAWKIILVQQLAKSFQNRRLCNVSLSVLQKMDFDISKKSSLKISSSVGDGFELSYKNKKSSYGSGYFHMADLQFFTNASRDKYFIFIKDVAVICILDPQENFRTIGSQLKRLFGVQCFGGSLTERHYIEIFDLAYRCACSQMSITAIEPLHDVFRQHWEKSDRLKEINLRGYQMTNRDFVAITHTLSHYPFISTICLRNCAMDSKGLVILLEGLARYDMLKSLDIGMNKHIDSEGTGKVMEDFLKTCKLKSLNLMSCDISSDTFSTFFHTLKKHATLLELDLSFNDVDDSLCGLISEIISRNYKLQKMVLWNSCLTEEPAKKLYEVLKDRPKHFSYLHIDLHGSNFVSNETIMLFENELKIKTSTNEGTDETIVDPKQTQATINDQPSKEIDDFLDIGSHQPNAEENTFTLKEMLVDVMLTQQIILKRQVLQYQKQMEHYQLSINMVQIRTPRTFCILPSPEDKSWKKISSWGKETFRLHLLCEGSKGGSVGDIHFIQDHEGYLIEQPSMFLKKVLPLLSIGMKVLSTAAKIAGTVIGAGGLVPNADVLKTLGIVSKKSGDIASLLQQVQDSIRECNSQVVENPEIQVTTGAALRSLEVFLNENDELRHFGGLQSVAGPDGRWAWVCDQHAKF
ncbi:uncharacterized protein [Clytia hemisphaerica]